MVSDWAWYSETLCARFLSLERKKKIFFKSVIFKYLSEWW